LSYLKEALLTFQLQKVCGTPFGAEVDADCLLT
jgi:hypothetical protein